MITEELPNPAGATTPRAGEASLHASLPDSLSLQFDSLKQRLWRLDATVAATGCVGSLLLSWLLLFASDRLWDTPHWIRSLLAFGGWTGFAIFAIGYGNRWLWAKPSVGSLAVIVQRRYRRLGDRLLGIVELADPRARPSNYSAELCRAAIAQVAAEAASFDFREAAVRKRPMRQLLGFAALVLVIIGLAITFHAAAGNALARWFRPYAGITRYTFAAIDPLPNRMIVPQGEPFDLSLILQPHSWWRPATARAHFQGAPAVSVVVERGIAKFNLPGQTQERTLWVSIGDVTRAIRIQPMVRPDLQSIDAEIHLPSYLHYPVQTMRIDTGSINFLPGTTVKFSGSATQPLGFASIEGDKPLKLQVRGNQFSSAPVLLELERDLQFTWRDKFGLTGPGPMTIHAVAIEDEPPHVELSGIEPAIGILPEETVHLDLNSSDDYGVQRIALTWQTAAPSPNDPPGPEHEILIAKGQPQARALGGHFSLSPILLGVEANTTLLVRAEAFDYYPSRKPSLSPIYRIHVLDRQAHAQLIHDQFEKLMEQLEELARQSSILQAGKAVRAQDSKQLANDASAQKLGQQSSQQTQTASDLQKLAKQMASTLAEAMRNPDISPDTLKSWAGHTAQMNQLASQSMPAAAQSLSSAQSQSQPSDRAQNLDQAISQEQKILDSMRQMENQASKDLESLMAKTLAGRLRHVAQSERGIATDLVQMLPDTVGLTTEQLTDDQRQKIQQMSTAHTASAQETTRLEGEISRLYDRTALDRYGDVAKEMISWKTDDGMVGLGNMIDQDIGALSIETARYWGDQFERWASRLEQDDQSKSNNGNGKPGQPDPAQMQALMALMQLRQRQDQLREQTETIEEQKQTLPDYNAQAQDAQTQQSALRDAVNALAQTPQFPVPPEKLKPVGKAMDDASGLLARPETGKPTNDAQADAINLLDLAIAQQSQKAGQSASAMAALMGMGGHTAGGTTNKPNQAIPGSREGAAGDQRTIIQAGGVDNSELPGEFRDAIEGYQRAMDQSK